MDLWDVFRGGWGRGIGASYTLAWGPAFGVDLTLWRCKILGMAGLCKRQPNGESAALPQPCAGHVNLSVVGFDERLRDGQSQANATGVPGPISVDAVEAVKDAWNVFGCDAVAVIGN